MAQDVTQEDQDYTPREYEDELDADSHRVDRVTHELTDDPTESFGVPPEEFKDELGKLDTEGIPGVYSEGEEDMRESIEDIDEDPAGKDR